MAGKKSFDPAEATSKFFSSAPQSPAADTGREKRPARKSGATLPRRQGKPQGQSTHSRRTKRYNLLLDEDLDAFLHEIVWQKRTTMTQYINDLIRAELEAYEKESHQNGTVPYWKQERVT